MSKFELHLGDCLETLRTMPDNSVDSIVTDPPYGLSFMGKRWDYDVPSVEIWAECLRVLKPGGHLLAFAGTRTQHRMAVRIEDAGFEIRDLIAWVYGSGFPKSLDVSKAIDKAAGAEREVIGIKANYHSEGKRAGSGENMHGVVDGSFSNPEAAAQITAPATGAARQWSGWGTALKPALEPITVARKPLVGTVAANVLQHGTGALNIDGCRVPSDESQSRPRGSFPHSDDAWGNGRPNEVSQSHDAGRWPANLIHDGSEEVLAGFPQSSSGANPTRRGGMGFHGANGQDACSAPRGPETGSAARFFYCAKASKADRGPDNIHPTVKPTDLMAYLVRLVTPPGGTVLDPFMGSGSTGKAAMLEGFRFIGIELSPEYLEIARARIAHAAGDAHAQKPPANASQIGLFA